ncbi:MAG: hypothetical protein RLO52_18330 [Sandaracinaceae bacterium]
MRVSCESCGAAVPAEDVNLERMVAKCRSCQAVFEVRAPSKAPAERPIVSAGRVPDGVEVSEGAADPSAYREAGAAPPLVLTRRWLHAGHKIAMGLALLLLVITLVVFAVGVARGDLVLMLLPVVFLFIAAAMLGYGALGLLNTTRLSVAGGQLKVEHGPLPAFGAPVAALSLGSVRAIEVRKQRRVSGESSGVYYLYRVVAQLHDGREVDLLRGLRAHEQARFFQQRLAQRLAA